MGQVGNFGDISFYCKTVKNKSKILSFHDLSRSSSATYTEHERNGGKAQLEFGSDGLDELTLTIEADARYRIKPLSVEKKLFERKEKGAAEFFVIGGKRIGENPYVITSISETYKVLHTDGRPIKLSFQLTLKEYVLAKKKKTKKQQKKAAKKAAKTASDTGNDRKEAAVKKKGSTSYTVKENDSLWNIAKKFYGSGTQYTKIYNANRNKIKNPNIIQAGMTLAIPR